MAWGVGPGDAVFVPAFTFTATAEVVALAGAEPVFVDVDKDLNMSVESLKSAIPAARNAGLTPRGIIPVDLFGLPADYKSIREIADAEGLFLLADAAQSFGATTDDKPVGSLAPVTGTSFFPAKPLGCYGDGGAIFTMDDSFAAELRSIRTHGRGSHKYENVRVGLNGRLDTLQAAVLRPKLRLFPTELADRRRVARAYIDGLADVVDIPQQHVVDTSAWAQFTFLVDQRDVVNEQLQAAGVPTAVYYPTPLNKQPAYRDGIGASMIDTSYSDELCTRSLSIPMHPYLTDQEIDEVVTTLRKIVAAI